MKRPVTGSVRTRVAMAAAAECLCALRLPAAEDDLAKSKSVYGQQLQAIRQETEKGQADALVRYRKALDAARQAAKQQGDLDAVQAADAEIRRFDAQKTLPPAAGAAANAELGQVRTAGREAWDKAELDGAKKAVQLTEQYLLFLDQRVKQAVRDDKLDVAKAFKTEMDAARQTPDYQAARFLLGEQQSVAEKPDPAPPENKPPAATNAPPAARTGPNGERIQLHVDPDGLYDAARIFEGVPVVSLTAPSPYRPLGVTETGKAPLGGVVGVALDGYLEANQSRYQLRMKLRPKVVGESLQNLKLLVQYFVRNPNGGETREARLQYAQITNVSSRQTTCEMKPAELPVVNIVHIRGGNIFTDRDSPFCGVVVSVFTADDKLIGQVTSAPTLKDRGHTAFELPPEWTEHIVELVPGPDGTIHIRHGPGPARPPPAP